MYSETKKVREINGQQFIDDFKKHREILVSPQGTRGHYRLMKSDVWEMAKTYGIHYYITDRVFKKKRNVMVIY